MNQFNGHNGQSIMTQEQQLAIMKVQLEGELTQLVEKNRAGFTDLQRRGINFDPGQLMSARVDCLIESIAGAFGPQGEVWAVQVRLDFERFIEAQVAAANEQGRKAQLAAGGLLTPQMIRQLAKETNTFGSRP